MTMILNIALSILVLGLVGSAFLVDGWLGLGLPGRLSPLGWPFILSGAGLVLWAVLTLARDGGATGAPGHPTRFLVHTGPFARVRNPIYAGAIVVLFGLACLRSSPTLVLYDLLLMLAIDQYVRRVEEPALFQQFGEDYGRYLKDVPRWLPRRIGAHQGNG